MPQLEIEKQQKRQASKWLKNQAKDAKLWVTLTIGIGFLSGLLLILQMYFLAHIAYASYIEKISRAELIYYFIGILILVVIRAGLVWLKEVVSFQTSARVRQSLRMDLLKHLNKLGPVRSGKISSGELVSSAMEQVEGLNNFLVYYLPQMMLAVLIPVAILVFVFPISIVSGVILLICAPLIPFFMALVGLSAASLHHKNFQTIARMSSHFLDMIQGLVTLKLLGRSKEQSKQIFNISDEYRKKTMSVLRIAFLSSAVLEVFSAASIALLAIYLGMGFINLGTDNPNWWNLGSMTLQGALFILLLAPEFFLPLRELGTHYHARAEAIGAAIEIEKIFALKTDTHELANTSLHLDNTQANWSKPEEITLSFQDVNVSYAKNERNALSNLNLDIQAGEKVAIVGPSGAGKTTILNLVLQFINVASGKITINGTNLDTIDSKNWYNSVSWLGQNPTLFQGTIRENLLLAKIDATDDELYEALKFAHLEKMVKDQNEGLNTTLGEQSLGLSGGQAQRLALARAYLKDTPLLLLDEPTSSLDHDNEREVLNSLSQFWQEKTVILLTHRLDFLEKMDTIVVLNQGGIAQRGTLDELLVDTTGLFYQLYFANEEY